MALGRPSKLSDLMSKYGVSSEDLVNRVYVGGDEKMIKEGLRTLDLVLDYRNTNTETVRKFVKGTGATDEEIESAVADVELYKKEFKSELDKKVQAKISEAKKAYEAQEAQIYAEYDEEVKNVITNEVYGKGADYVKDRAEKKASEKKKKESKPTEVTTDSPVEEETVADPFAN